MSENLDDDDKFLIRTLFLKGNTYAQIAKKRNHPEEVVQDVLEEFKKKGQDASRAAKSADEEDADYREAAFWYFQYGKYVLDRVDPKYEIVIKKAEKDYSGFKMFLEGETERHTNADKEKDPGIDVNSKWEFVDQLWMTKKDKYQTDETDDGDYESKNGKKSGGLMSVDNEETNMNSVCQIFSEQNKLLGCGSYVQFGDKTGILTLNDILENTSACQNVSVKFETLEEDIHGSLKPDVRFLTNNKLNTTFVAFESQQDIKDLLTPLTYFQDIEKDLILYGYYHHANGFKVQLQKKIVSVKSGEFGYDSEPKAATKGIPMFAENFLIGIDKGTKSSDQNTQLGISIIEIQKWIDSVTTFSKDDKVMAKWSDGFDYKATIRHKTETGYMIFYDDFNQEADQAESSLTLVSKNTNQVEKVEADGDEMEGTTTALDKTDIQFIITLAGKGKDAEHISRKLNIDQDRVQEVMDKNKSFDQKKWDAFVKWLKKNKLEKYEGNFRASDCHSMDTMLEWKQHTVMQNLQAIGIKAGPAYKIIKLLTAHQTYSQTMTNDGSESSEVTSKEKGTIAEINNSPMAANWAPTDELDLTEEFKKPGTNKASISYACKQLLGGLRPSALPTSQGKDTKFYVKSGTHNRYFEITITWA